jgi:hypothetical protein
MKQDLNNMYAEERQLWIVERARAGGRVEVAAAPSPSSDWASSPRSQHATTS